ncbi:DUF4097 family beta strand repeat protein [Pseudoflavitalea sp. X16]|uniref:DUF4097 family beta strand repeat-containing protein n=1 Tax=Paraflavitalea devenefica TaxID=2716334 RepID=UPI0014210EC2|nr:DUF4097 family beta strand repeat-containing protein [Paraflavitalea devenefica]NII24717.1 DUF4097 family beta strand repeat protein [Paraflavitalea devenefica]
MNNKKIFPFLLLAGTLLTAGSTNTQAQQTLTKEISQEVPSQKGSLIRLVSTARKVTIKPWDQAKVKVTVELVYDTAIPRKNRTDAEWFEDMGINIKPFSNRVDILTGASVSGVSSLPLKTVTVAGYRQQNPIKRKGEKGDVIVEGYRSGTPKEIIVKGFAAKPAIRVMTILVPAGCKLDLENKYGDVSIGMNVDEAKLEITNGALDAQDIKDLKLVGNYCNANLGNIEKAEVEFTNGTFRAQNINDLDMDSKSSTIEYEKGSYLYIRSQADHFSIDAIDKVDGRKVYGSIKIDQLNNSFDLEGNNVDIKFRNIGQDVSLIRINNKYGDVRLPVKNLKNYYVDFIGNYSTVFASFQKEVVKEEEKKEGEGDAAVKEAGQAVTVTRYKIGTTSAVGEVAPRHFTSANGDTKGKHTRIELTCHSCTVDFK